MGKLISLDEGAIQELSAVQDRLASVWPNGVNEILQQRNPELLAELTRLESVMDSLLAIPNKPASLRSHWRDTLEQYEKTSMLCITYAKRHLPLAK